MTETERLELNESIARRLAKSPPPEKIEPDSTKKFTRFSDLYDFPTNPDLEIWRLG